MSLQTTMETRKLVVWLIVNMFQLFVQAKMFRFFFQLCFHEKHLDAAVTLFCFGSRREESLRSKIHPYINNQLKKADANLKRTSWTLPMYWTSRIFTRFQTLFYIFGEDFLEINLYHPLSSLTSKHQVQVCCCCWVSLPTLPREQWCFALFIARCLEGVCFGKGKGKRYVMRWVNGQNM